MSFANIIYSKREEIAQITINRPDKRNALDRATRLEILSALEDGKTDTSIKVLVVSGKGGQSFVAGSDLTELSKFNSLEMEEFMATLGQNLYTRFEQLTKPVIAMIDGLCLGGGLELAMACDLRFASESSRFGQPEILLGIIPGGGGTQRLTRLVGVGRAKEMIFTGKTIDAEEALRIGLINGVCKANELEEHVMKTAQIMARHSPLAVMWAKKTINMGQEVALSTGLSYEALAECLLFTSKDREEGMKAFFEKRSPAFIGK